MRQNPTAGCPDRATRPARPADEALAPSARVDVPPLYCPLETSVHPMVRQIAENSIAWMAGFGFCDDADQRERVVGSRGADWMCRLAPYARPAGLQIASDWVYCGFALDDARFDMGPGSRSPERVIPAALRLLHVADQPEAGADSGDPFELALRDLSVRMRATATPDVVRRWADGNADWFLAAAYMAAHRAADRTPPLAEYLAVGPRDRGARASMALIETAEHTSLPVRLMEQARIRAATQAAYLLVTIGNDLFSYRRESHAGPAVSNLVGVLLNERGGTLDEAMHEAVALHDRVMCLYLALRERLAAGAPEELDTYLGQLDHYIRGNHDWSLTVPRYHREFGGTGAPAAVAEYADKPADGSLTAPPHPAIAWWWDQL